MRVRYEGCVFWLKTTWSKTNASREIWGCVGAWYSGDWNSSAANGYISRVQGEAANLTWLAPDWPSIKPSCDPAYGCPGPDPL